MAKYSNTEKHVNLGKQGSFKQTYTTSFYNIIMY